MKRNWNRKCRRWRRACIRRLAWKYQSARHGGILRSLLMAGIFLECCAWTGLFFIQAEPELSLFREEERCEVELITNSRAAGGQEPYVVYGMRLDLEALEVQFYRRQDLLRERP